MSAPRRQRAGIRHSQMFVFLKLADNETRLSRSLHPHLLPISDACPAVRRVSGNQRPSSPTPPLLFVLLLVSKQRATSTESASAVHLLLRLFFAQLHPTQGPHASTIMGKAGSVGLEVLDTLGSNMTNLNAHISTDSKEVLRIAAADKREELDVFSREVVRFGFASESTT
ncbi:hypothetical protein LXL04_006358 [Taraxacum kok-saghyz]